MDEGEIEKDREGDGNGERNGVGNTEREKERERAWLCFLPAMKPYPSVLRLCAYCSTPKLRGRGQLTHLMCTISNCCPSTLFTTMTCCSPPPPPPPPHTHTMLTFSRHLLTTAKRAQAVHKLSCILQHRPSGRHSPTFSSLDLLPSSLANCIKKTGSLGKPLHTMV